MNGKGIIELYLIGNLIGYTAGTLITLLLLALTLRAVKFPGTPIVNILLATCAFFWNLFGLIHAYGYMIGLSPETRIMQLAKTLQLTAASLWPITMIIIWRQFAAHPNKHIYSRCLQSLAMITGTILTIMIWVRFAMGIDLHAISWLKEMVVYNGVILTLCAIIELKGRYTSRVVWISSFTTLIALLSTTLSITLIIQLKLNQYLATSLSILSTQSTLLIVLGSFFLFARFRYSDQVIKYSLRILLVGITAIIIIFLVNISLTPPVNKLTAFPSTSDKFYLGIRLTFLLACFAIFDQAIRKFVDRKIFRAPDYKEALQVLNNELTSSKLDSDIARKVQDKCKNVLEVDDVTSVKYEELPDSLRTIELHSLEIVEINRCHQHYKTLSLSNVELFVPIVSRGNIIAVLAVSPGPARRGLVTHEINFLRSVATLYGNRIESLHFERETLAQQQREAMMQQQIVEAELRALRAQINPHFLFNALNSLANLIVINPVQAEAMTLRLAEIFRYVLMHSSRSMTSIREEIEFLRTYLHIEEARFGDRLRVDIDIDNNTSSELIPSLILQPIVENALKHGLAPKPGNGHLRISAMMDSEYINLQVEDDGIGLANNVFNKQIGTQFPQKENSGVGLKNIAERLRTLYGEKSNIDIKSRESGGVKVTVSIPRLSVPEVA